MTVTRRLSLIGAVGLISVAATAAVATWAAESEARQSAEMARISAGLSRQWNADMMHDGIRGDVMAAMYATTAAERKSFEVADVRVKADAMLAHFDAAAAAAPAGTRAEFHRQRQLVSDYAEQAVNLVATAEQDKAAARAELPAFIQKFGQLEENLGVVDELMLAAVHEREAATRAAAGQARVLIILIGALAAAVFVAVGWATGRSMLRSLRQLLAALKQVAERDLTVRVTHGSRDEFADMGRALNTALDEVGETISAAGRATATLNRQCTTLRTVSQRLGEAAGKTAARAGSVAASARQVSANVESMSSATDQLDSAINDIAGQTSTAAGVAAEAVQAASRTGETVGQLNRASEEIGEIVKAITSIAEQTNLLALNATIEAARAGEAGKGFAVVATEVKELAQETSRATEDITTRIAGIQAMTGQATDAIEHITTIIDRINQNQSTVAAAVEQQSATTAQITRGIAEVAEGAGHIADNVAGIAVSTDDTSASATSTQHAAEELTVLAVEVNGLIGKFTL